MTLLRIVQRWPRTSTWGVAVAYAAYVAWIFETAR